MSAPSFTNPFTSLSEAPREVRAFNKRFVGSDMSATHKEIQSTETTQNSVDTKEKGKKGKSQRGKRGRNERRTAQMDRELEVTEFL